MASNGWDLYEELIERDWDTLTQAQQALIAIGELRDEVNNGGFEQYFLNSGGNHARVALETCESLGETELSALLRRAIDVLGEENYSSDWDQRRTALQDVDEDAFDAIDEEYFALESSRDLDQVMDSLAAQ